MSVVDRSFEHPLDLEEKAADPMAGGILQYGFQCGMIWGAALAAGAEAYQQDGPGALAETKALFATQQVVEAFRSREDTINCVDISNLDKSSTPLDMLREFLFKGGTIRCARMAARYAPVAFDEINKALAEAPGEAPEAPVSCAALMAQQRGASEMQIVMAAGLAGGIGLSGGACGALGAAIWLDSIQRLSEGETEVGFNDAKAAAIVDQFVEASEYEFECAEIVGRKFTDGADHAAYVAGGGCAKIIEVLTEA